MLSFYIKLILIILPGSGLGLLPFTISPVVPTGSTNCDTGTIPIMYFICNFSILSTAKCIVYEMHGLGIMYKARNYLCVVSDYMELTLRKQPFVPNCLY